MPARTFFSQDGFERRDPSWKLNITDESSTYLLEDENFILGSSRAAEIRGGFLEETGEQESEEGESFFSSSSSSNSSFCTFDLPPPQGPAPDVIPRPKKTSVNKRVHFAPTKIVYIEKVRAEEKKHLWFSPLEMILIKKDCLFTLCCLSNERLMASMKGLVASTRFSTRGLEGHSGNEQCCRSEMKREAWNAVFQEQWSQRNHHSKAEKLVKNGRASCHRRSSARVCNGRIVHLACVLDQEAIAQNYMKTSFDSKQEAVLRGLQDEREAKMLR